MENEIKIVYTNQKGETSIRRLVPETFFFGSSEWHPEKQWLMEAIDADKKEKRTFALKEIRYWYLQ